MIRHLVSVAVLGSMFAAVGCATPPADETEGTSDAINAAPECNPLAQRTTTNAGDVEGLTAMVGTPFPALGPDAEGYFYPPVGYTEGGTFAHGTDGEGGKWKVDADDIAAPAPAGKVRIVEWNVERGNQLDKVIRLMKKTNGDVWMLNESDLYGRNSGGVVVAREIARALGYSYYTGIEFYERRDDRRGTSGNAIVSRYPLKNTRSVEIPILADQGGHDWSTDSGEPRCGQRNALAVSIDAPLAGGGTRAVDLVGLHTENKSNAKVRLAQYKAIVDELVTPGHPTIVAGDLNTVSFGEGGSFRKELAARNTQAGLSRSLFDCSRGDDTTTFSAAVVVNLRIDWMLVQTGDDKNIDCPVNSYKVHGNDGASDHKPVVLDLTVK